MNLLFFKSSQMNYFRHAFLERGSPERKGYALDSEWEGTFPLVSIKLIMMKRKLYPCVRASVELFEEKERRGGEWRMDEK